MAQSGTGYLRPKRLLSHLWPGILAVFGIHAAAAQSTPLSPSSPQQLPAYCTASKLTGAKFLQAIQKIIAHGDLMDVTFIEKTLRTKFDHNHSSSENIPPDPYHMTLSSDHILGNPIPIRFDEYVSKSDQLKFDIIAGLAIGQQSNFIADCFHLTPEYISSYFGGGFFRKVFYGSPLSTYYQINGSPAKNGTKISIGFRVVMKSNTVESIAIGQNP